jgi:hypothetical protein
MRLPGRPDDKTGHGDLARDLAAANRDMKSIACYRDRVNQVARDENPPERLRDAFRHAQDQPPADRGAAFGRRWRDWTAPKPPPAPLYPVYSATERRAREAAEDAARPAETLAELEASLPGTELTARQFGGRFAQALTDLKAKIDALRAGGSA